MGDFRVLTLWRSHGHPPDRLHMWHTGDFSSFELLAMDCCCIIGILASGKADAFQKVYGKETQNYCFELQERRFITEQLIIVTNKYLILESIQKKITARSIVWNHPPPPHKYNLSRLSYRHVIYLTRFRNSRLHFFFLPLGLSSTVILILTISQ